MPENNRNKRRRFFQVTLVVLVLLLAVSHAFIACSGDDDDDPTPTPTPTMTPTPTLTPRTDPIITDVWPAYYSVKSVTNGEAYYGDSPAPIQGMPHFLQGAQVITTTVSDKNVTAFPYVQFTVDRPIKVYIGYDDSSESLPNWLGVFVKDTGQYVTLGAPVDRRFQLYYHILPAGTRHLGGNFAWGASGDPSTYLVFIKGYEGEWSYPGPRRIDYYDYSGDFRNWYLAYPEGYQPYGHASMLYFLRGAQTYHDYLGDNVEETGLTETCSAHGFLLVAPSLSHTYWGSTDFDIQVDYTFLTDLQNFSRYFFPHDPHKLFCTGFSSGAFFTNLTSLIPPLIFTAIAPFSGGFPDNSPYLPASAEQHFPVMLIVGENDSIQTYVEEAYDLYDQAGFPVELHFIPGLDHNWYVPFNTTIINFFLNSL
ncbi:hypothetical protein JXQ70_00060 [bacterium]|nr:hypothetical protein [bacterium]